MKHAVRFLYRGQECYPQLNITESCVQFLRDDGIKCRTEVKKQQPHVGVLVLQVREDPVDHSSDGVGWRPVSPACILVRVHFSHVDRLF